MNVQNKDFPANGLGNVESPPEGLEHGTGDGLMESFNGRYGGGRGDSLMESFNGYGYNRDDGWGDILQRGVVMGRGGLDGDGYGAGPIVEVECLIVESTLDRDLPLLLGGVITEGFGYIDGPAAGVKGGFRQIRGVQKSRMFRDNERVEPVFGF